MDIKEAKRSQTFEGVSWNKVRGWQGAVCRELRVAGMLVTSFWLMAR